MTGKTLALFTFMLIVIMPAKMVFCATSELPRTGQTTCYDAIGTTIECVGTGQDGEIQSGLQWPTPRFVDNGDQTVTDKLTDLVWTKDANLRKTRNPIYDAIGIELDVVGTWYQSLDYVNKLNTENYLGYNDWRLPNIIELGSLINKVQSNPADWLIGQGFSNVQPRYWSGSTNPNSITGAWYVAMVNGNVITNGTKTSYNGGYVWPVRSGLSVSLGSLSLSKTGQSTSYYAGDDGAIQAGMPWPNPRFIDNSLTNSINKTVTDNLTGLIWCIDANLAVVGKNWQQSLDYIKILNSINYLGYNDWRLPNINELESLINKLQSNPSAWLNGQGFLNVQSSNYYYWSSSSNSNSKTWWVDLQRGGVSSNSRDYSPGFVWPVRGGLVPLPLSVVKSGSGSGTVTSSIGGINCGSTCSASISPTTSLTLTATPNSGSTFTGWSGSCSGTSVCQLTLDIAKNVTANFDLAATTGNCGTSNGFTFTIAPTTNFCTTGTATAVTGAGPWGWTCTGSNGGTTATCNASIQTWTINSGTGNNGTVFCTSPVKNGATSTCTVSLASGYQLATFTDNSIDQTGSVAGGSYSIANVTANHSVAATFIQIPPSLVNGACGTSNGSTFTVIPTTNFCTTGSATTIIGTGPWSWNCSGTNGGTTATCAASIATSTPTQFTVTPTPGTGFTITPATPQTATNNSTTFFTVIPSSGYGIASVSGCSGSFSGGTYSTGPITANCTISVTSVARNANSYGPAQPPTISDALKVLQSVVGITPMTATEKIRYDVAPLSTTGTPLGNGVLDAADVIAILRRSIGIGSW